MAYDRLERDGSPSSGRGALNADMSYAQAASEKLAGEQVDLEGSYKDMGRKTPATIGKGEIRILKEGNHELNRDLRQARREALRGENFRSGFCYDTAKSYLDIAAEFATNIGEALGITTHNAQDFTLGTGTEPEEDTADEERTAYEEEQQELARLAQEKIANLEEAESLEEAHIEESEGELIAVDASGGQCELPELKPKWPFIDYTPIPMQGEVQETGEITKLKVAAGYARQVISNYQEFAAKYPNLAQYGLSVANVAVQSAIGSVAGFMNAVRAEATGYAIGSAAGEQIEAVVDNTIGATAYSFKLADASLSDEDARALAALGLLSLWGGSQGKELATSALKKHHIDKFKFEDSHDPTKFHFEGNSGKAGSKKTVQLKIWEVEHIRAEFKEIKIEHHEGGIHKGHTIERHISKSQVFLESRNMPIASSYPDKATAERVIGKIIHENAEEITKWANDRHKFAPKEFKYDFKEQIIGYSFKQGEDGMRQNSKAIVVLKKLPGGDIKILTSYPID